MADIDWLAEQAWQRLNGTTGLTAFDGVAPATPPGGYAVYYPSAGSYGSTRQGGGQSGYRWGFRVVCAGSSRAQVFGTVKRVRARFLNHQLDPSPSSDPLQEDDLDPPLLRDDSVPSDIRFSQTLFYYLSNRS